MKSFLRVWKQLELEEIAGKLVVVGELSSQCFSCRKIGIDIKSRQCPFCGCQFKYMGFRRKVDAAYLKRIKEENPDRIFIDFGDFKAALERKEARKILDI